MKKYALVCLSLLVIVSGGWAKNPLFYGADPSGRVFPDGRMWIFPTTDKADWDEQYDWHAWSSEDLVTWKDHGVIFDLRDSGWATGHAWAPDILHKDGRYYFYYYAHQGEPSGGVGVAISDKPAGPYKEALGHQLVKGHDPAIFMDRDQQVYLYLQNKAYVLNPDLISIKGEGRKLVLHYKDGKDYDEVAQRYEAVYVFERNGIYYYTIADGWNHLIYFTGDNPLGPFTYRGELMDKYGGNNHHSILEYKGKWILWYHGWVPGHHRMVRGEYVNFNEDGTIQKIKITEKGVGPIYAQRGGYLFAHMTKGDYGRLYYTVSLDGQHWQRLNDGHRVNEDYKGHPDITQGHDGRYYMTGGSREITLWESDDLLSWSKMMAIEPNVYGMADYQPIEKKYGAAKIYFDEATAQYLITWHTSQAKADYHFETYWSGQRTCYVTTKDFRAFSDPRRLFQYDMATIDVIVRNIGGRYYALLKDERYPTFAWPHGKAIRVATAPTLTGPWSAPSPRITSNYREAPTLIPRPDGNGWLLYTEQYPGVQYTLTTAPTINGPWYDEYIKYYEVPEEARHGCMIRITQEQYDAIMAKYGNKENSQP